MLPESINMKRQKDLLLYIVLSLVTVAREN